MHIIVIGCGRMGSGLAELLDRKGHSVVVVDRDESTCQRLAPSFKGRHVIGIGIDRDVLLEAGIERADGLAALTSSDDTNVVAARLARQVFRVPRVVARVYDPRKAEIYQRLGLPTVSTTTWGIQRASEVLTFSQLDTIHSLGSGGVDIVETEVPALLVGRPISGLTAPGEISIIAITRNNQTFLPLPGATFRAGDLVHLAVTAAASDRLNALLA
ncbi:MAG: TrkA family potassium uptake protein [Anaerolineae bacterium]